MAGPDDEPVQDSPYAESNFYGYRYVALSVIKVLINVQSGMEGGDGLFEMLTMLLKLFDQIGIDGCRYCERPPPSIVAA